MHAYDSEVTFSALAIAAPLVGGALIGLAASVVLFAHGKVAGISGIFGGLFQREAAAEAGALGAPADQAYRIAFVAGLLAAGLALGALQPGAFAGLNPPPVSLPLVAVAGVLVGFGTRLGGGCTSGHGICGIARFSGRSIVATLTFMATGAVTVFVVRHLLTGAP